MFTDGFIEVFHKLGHAALCNSLPGFFNYNYLTDTFQLSHFGNKKFHSDQGHNLEEYRVIFNIVQFYNHEGLVQYIQILLCIEQVIKFPTLVEGPEHIQEVVHIKIPILYMVCLQFFYKFGLQEFIKGIKAGKYILMKFQVHIIRLKGIGNGYVFTSAEAFVILFP
ncbi:hypothetical protein D9M68_746130 [compost metagenome]